MNKIKIFVDGHVFDNEYQGTRTFIKELYTALLFIGHPFQIFIAAQNIENLKKIFGENTGIIFLKYSSHSKIKRLCYDIPKLIRKNEIDIAHFQYIIPPIKNCKFLVTTHDIIFNDFPEEFSLSYRIIKNLLYKISIKRADIITTVSNFSKSSIKNYYKIKSENIHIIPNGVARKFFENFERDKSKDYIFKKYGIKNFILYVSRIEPRKNHKLLLTAFLNLKLFKKGMYLVFLGKESIPVKEFKEELESMDPAIKQYVYIDSEVDDDDLLEFYRAARLFVYPSKAEGFGIPPLEAAALKTNTLCSNSSAMADFSFFEDKAFDPDNYPEFEEKLRLNLDINDQERLKELSQIVESKYSWETSAKILKELILRNS